jgi:hypothetical protein
MESFFATLNGASPSPLSRKISKCAVDNESLFVPPQNEIIRTYFGRLHLLDQISMLARFEPFKSNQI